MTAVRFCEHDNGAAARHVGEHAADRAALTGGENAGFHVFELPTGEIDGGGQYMSR